MAEDEVLFRILRIGKLARALRVVTMSNTLASLELLTKCLQSSVVTRQVFFSTRKVLQLLDKR